MDTKTISGEVSTGRAVASVACCAALVLGGCSSSSGNGAGGSNASSTSSTSASGSTSSSASSSTSSSSTGGPAVTGPVVFLIMMENSNWSTIKGSSSAPYINSLLTTAAHAEQFYNPPSNHPSEPNYLWLEAGTNFGVTDDFPPSFNSQTSTSHLVDQIEAAKFTWKSYQEDIPGTDCPLADVNNYAVRHNPMVFFQDVSDDNSTTSTRCISHVRPYSELATDLASDHEANYNFIAPNLCDDMHTACPPMNDEIAQGDTWLSQQIPKLLASNAYAKGATIFITWDEGTASMSDGPIGMIVLGNAVKAGYSNTIKYTHSSTLRTMQEIFGLSPFLGDAANATDLSDLFTKLP